MAYAPIIMFGYRRPEHLTKTIESLQQCPEFRTSPVFVFIDGPKNSNEEAAVLNVRNVAQKLIGENATYVFSEHNKGLAQSIIDGLEQVFATYEAAIVIEDDLIVSPSFLKFMNVCLDRYSDSDEIFQISGYFFEDTKISDPSSVLFLPFISSWGWATWSKKWRKFDGESSGWQALVSNRKLRYQFDVRGSYPYSKMLIKKMRGEINSWAIQWNWTVFKNEGRVVYPPFPLVLNIGLDGSGTNGRRFSIGPNVQLPDSLPTPNMPPPRDLLGLDQSAIEQALLKRAGNPLRRFFSNALWRFFDA